MDELLPCPFCTVEVKMLPKEKWVNKSVPAVSHFSECPCAGYHRLDAWQSRTAVASNNVINPTKQ